MTDYLSVSTRVATEQTDTNTWVCLFDRQGETVGLSGSSGTRKCLSSSLRASTFLKRRMETDFRVYVFTIGER